MNGKELLVEGQRLFFEDRRPGQLLGERQIEVIDTELDGLREQVRVLRDAIKAHEHVMTCDDQTGLEEALAATEPKQ